MLVRTLTIGLAVVLFLPSLLWADDAPKGDKDLEGDWQVQSWGIEGNDGDVSDKNYIFTFAGNRLTWAMPDYTSKWTVKLDVK